MKKILLILAVVFGMAGLLMAETATFTPTITKTNTPTATPTSTVIAGQGTCVLEPLDINSGTLSQPIQITFTAATANMTNGVFIIYRPQGWPDFSSNTYNAGYISVTTTGKGAPSNISRYLDKVVVTLPSLNINQTIVMRYGGIGFAIPSVTVSKSDTFYVYTASNSLLPEKAKKISASPSIAIRKTRGSGTISQLPTVTIPSTYASVFTWIYTAGVTITAGNLSIDKPAAFADFSSASTNTGYVTAASNGTIGTLAVSSNLVTIPITAMNVGQVITVKYGVSWTGAQPTTAGDYWFTVRSNGISGTASLAQPIATSVLYTVSVAATATPTPRPGVSGVKQKINPDGSVSADLSEDINCTNVIIVGQNQNTLAAMPYILSSTAKDNYTSSQNWLSIRGIDISTDSTSGTIYVYASRTAQVSGIPLATLFATANNGRISTNDVHYDLLPGEPVDVSITGMSAAGSKVFIRLKYKNETPQW